MCGLAGVVRFDSRAVDRELASRLDAALAHRGPDGSGSYVSPDGRALLTHRRLAIIDPSPASAQPMGDTTGRWQLVYNGEIYNYRALRDDLARDGVAFATGGDTEVLLQLLAVRGPQGLDGVRGMFAAALWDAREQSLLLVRDRFGIKPLYVARQSGLVAFASELQALRSSGLVTGDPAPAAVLAFLRWGSIIPPLTWDQNVAALEPGTWRRWSRDGTETTGRFARLSWTAQERSIAATSAEAESVIHAAVRDSVSAHLVSDVPVGLFLSGGLDSCALLASAADIGAAPTCFTVADGANDDEVDAARRVAAIFAAPWWELRVERDSVRQLIPAAVARLDQPSIDGPNTWVVARAAARIGLKTALSGAGGDELFGGYPSSRLMPLWDRLGRLAVPAARGITVLEQWRGRQARAAKFAHLAATDNVAERYRAIRGFVMPSELPAIIGPRFDGSVRTSAEAAVDAAEQQALAPRDEPLAAFVARAETELYLRSQLLRDLDVMSMSHALEVRVPFVDHVLLSATWPSIASYPELLDRKTVLRRILAKRVPADILSRPKAGFTLPFDRWIGCELKEFTRAGIENAERTGWLARGACETIWNAWQRRQTHWSRPWGLAVLGHHLSSEAR